LDRIALLKTWLETQFPNQPFSLAPASADASFRRYFRASFADPSRHSLIVMDAPPAHEDCKPFLHVAQVFGEAGAHVPQVLAHDLAQGFLLLTDLGSTTYLQALQENPDQADSLYRDAVAALVQIQCASQTAVLPDYDEALLRRELDLFPDWYIARHLNIALSPAQTASLQQVFATLLQNNLAQPQVYVHRDYHSRNLMRIAANAGNPNPGILDFQDAVFGPVTYDLVSLFKDAYIAWDEERVLDWSIRYWEKAKRAGLPIQTDFADFYRDFEWMGAQRHIKVLGIFARLCHRDGKAGYVQDMPQVMDYLRKTCKRYQALHPMLILLDELHGVEKKVGHTF